MIWHAGRFELDLARPSVMGIVNVTPDSFSDGGVFESQDAAIAHARGLAADGAGIVDVGGESTRPGATPVPADVELGRVLPVIRSLADLPVPISVDTTKPEVMEAALRAGASIVNDINGFRAPGALDAVRATDCGLVVMHMLGEPRTMQDAPRYDDVVAEVVQFLAARVDELVGAGIAPSRIALDPGIGFGKTAEHNLQLLHRMGELAALGHPVVVGTSRKGLIGTLTGRPAGERDAGSIGAAVAGVHRGAHVVRVHDVRGTVDALRVWRAVELASLDG